MAELLLYVLVLQTFSWQSSSFSTPIFNSVFVSARPSINNWKLQVVTNFYEPLLCSVFSTTWCLSPPLTWILRKSHLSILWKQSTIPGIMQVANCVGLILCSKKVYNLFRETWDNIFCISGYYEMSVMEMAIIFIQREEGIVSAWANQERHLTWWHLSWVLKIIIGYSRQSEI